MVLSKDIEHSKEVKFKDTFNYLKFYIIYNIIAICAYGISLYIKYIINTYFNYHLIIFNKSLFLMHLSLHFIVLVILYFFIHTIGFIKNKNNTIVEKNVLTIGSRIKEARINKGLSKTMLAQKVDVSPKTITRWENDESIPNCEFSKKLESILEIDINEGSFDKETKYFSSKKFFLHFNLLFIILFNASNAINGIYFTIYFDLYTDQAVAFDVVLYTINSLYGILGVISIQIIIMLILKMVIYVRERRIKE
ncbi:MAG: helix-turn-helix domain-containing protein [Anaeroplasma sp.]